MNCLVLAFTACLATSMFATAASAVKLAEAPKKVPAANGKGSNPGLAKRHALRVPGLGVGKGVNQKGYSFGSHPAPTGYSTGSAQPNGYSTGTQHAAPSHGSAAAPVASGNAIGNAKAALEVVEK